MIHRRVDFSTVPRRDHNNERLIWLGTDVCLSESQSASQNLDGSRHHEFSAKAWLLFMMYIELMSPGANCSIDE